MTARNIAIDTTMQHLCALVGWLASQEALPTAVHTVILERIIELQEDIVDELKPVRIDAGPSIKAKPATMSADKKPRTKA